MSTALPIPRQTRQAILAATNVQTAFGPFDFPLFDEDDVQVWIKPTGGLEFEIVDTADYAVEAVTTFPGFFTVEFTDPPLPIAGGTVWIKGARLHKRETDVTQGGVVNSVAIERELDRQSVVAQELRRDVDALMGGTLPSDALASGIGNDSNVPGGTVKDALEGLDDKIDTLAASDIGNDSGVAGATVKDALNELSGLIAQAGSAIADVAATGNVNIATGLAAGQTLDGQVLVQGWTVLLPYQGADAQNGLYTVPAAGAAARKTGFTAYDSLCGQQVVVQRGTTHADAIFQCTSDEGGTIDVNALTFAKIASFEANPATNTYTPAGGLPAVGMYHVNVGNADNVRSIPNTKFDVPGIGPAPPAGQMFIMANYADNTPGNISNIYAVAWQSGTRYAAALTGCAVNASGGGSVWGVQGMGLANAIGAFANGGQFDAQVGATGVNANAVLAGVGPSTVAAVGGGEGSFPATSYLNMVANPGTAGPNVSPCSPLTAMLFNDTVTNPINVGGRILGTSGGNRLSCSVGIDFFGCTFSTAAIRSPGYRVDGSGFLTARGVGLGTDAALTNEISIRQTGTLTASRNLLINVRDASRTIDIAGNITTGGAFTLSGAFAATFTFTGTTTVTFPTTGTLATKSDIKVPILFNSNSAVAAGATAFYGVGIQSAADTVACSPMPTAGTVRNVYFRAHGAPGGGQTYTYTVQKNGVNTAITAVVSGAAQLIASDLVNSVSYAAGDTISVKVVASAGAAAVLHSAGLEFTPA